MEVGRDRGVATVAQLRGTLYRSDVEPAAKL
jgi:hypothetical protein